MKTYASHSFKIITFLLFYIGSIHLNHAQVPQKRTLHSIEDFTKLKGTPLTHKYGKVAAVKVVYDINEARLYFVNDNLYDYHYAFCNFYLGYRLDIDLFNKYNYTAEHARKRYLLGNINHYQANDLYTLELSPIDEMYPKDIEILYKEVQKQSYFKNFKFFINTARLERLRTIFNIPIVSAEELYGNQNYQAVSIQEGFGRLRFIDDIKKAKLSKNDIIVVNQPILNLPIVRGVITTRLQTPLSHISILGKNRKVPIVAYTKAYTNSDLRQFDNAYVSFKVKRDTFYIKKISEAVYLRKTKTKVKKKKALQKNTSVKGLLAMENLSHKDMHIVGGKAANFATLYQLAKTNSFKVPESSFAIPFYYYEQHLKASGADKLLDALLLDYEHGKVKDVKKRLKEIRNAIKKMPVSDTLIKTIEDKICALGSYKRMRFRSSTNAEDIVGFSGAGLYTSKTGIVGDTEKTIEKAVTKVWASLWKLKAFEERDYFNIDQRSVSMGILVHRSFPNEAANGVVITKNLYRKGYYGKVINVQLGEESVVDPKDGIVCDQILCYAGANAKLYDDKDIIEIISYSSINHGKLVLSEKEILTISEQTENIKKRFYKKVYKRKKSYLNFALDIEFKIDGPNRDLYIKQARYYND